MTSRPWPNLLLVAAVLATAGCSSPTANPSPGSSPSPETLARADTSFAIDLYRQLAPRPGNLFFSPYSLSEVLEMSLLGARGSTATEIAAVLHLEQATGRVATGFARLADQISVVGHEHVTLVAANSLWAQPQTSFADGFLQTLRSEFHAAATPVDFRHDPASARSTINAWVRETTRGRIPDLIGPGVLDARTRMALVNAIYFKGFWADSFEPRLTRPAPFFPGLTQSFDVPTMHRVAKRRTVAVDGLRLIELPYSGGTMSMVILLPDARGGLPEIERILSSEKLAVWLQKLDATGPSEVALALPRFNLSCGFDCGSQLKAMGMTAAFDPNAADFSGMTGDRSLYLSAVIHRAVLEVNEEGTVATAASGGVYAALAVMRPLAFTVDHPFLFLIRDSTSGMPLFLGRVENPR